MNRRHFTLIVCSGVVPTGWFLVENGDDDGILHQDSEMNPEAESPSDQSTMETDSMQRYNVGIDPEREDVIAEVKDRSETEASEVRLGEIRVIVTGTFTPEAIEEIEALDGVDYVERDQVGHYHEEDSE